MADNYRRTAYIEGNTVRVANPRREEYRTPRRVKVSKRSSRTRQVMNFGFVMFLSMALMITAFTCIEYLKLQSTITASVAEISNLERSLEELRAENDDMESRIKGSVCLEDVKKRAMDDLGMTYARQDQIVVYESDGTDYVRQFVALE